jgi:flotillin
VNKAQAKAEEERLNATEIVPAQKEKEKIIIGAEAEKQKMILEAEALKEQILQKAQGEAQATQIKLEAEAEGKKKLLLAEAEGKKASLMAEAEALQAKEQAPAMAFERMLKASAENPSLAVQFKMVDQYKHIAEAQEHMLEHINLGNVTVYGDSNTGAQFAKNIIEKLAPSLAMVNDGLKGQFENLFGMGKTDGTEIPAPKNEQLSSGTDTKKK